MLATVLQTEGSTPTKAGAMAVIAGGQVVAGTVGGGAVEAWCEHEALAVLERATSQVLMVHLKGDDIGEPDPICGGVMRVLLDPRPARHAAAFAEALAAVNRRERGCLLTTVRGEGSVQVTTEWLAEGRLETRTSPPAVECLKNAVGGEDSRRCVVSSSPGEGRIEVLSMPVNRRPLLVIVGGGHVGQAVAAQARLVGFEIIVIEDRREFADESLFPAGTRVQVGDLAAELAALDLDDDTFVVLVSRGHRLDVAALEVCLRRPAAYLGMIGSRRKVRMLREDWTRSGRATVEELNRVYAPIGLDLGAATVPEIACSVVAQLVAVRRRGVAARMPLEDSSR